MQAAGSYLPFFVLPPPFLCAASMLGHTAVLCRGKGLWIVPAWQGLPPSRELLDVSDRPLKAVANILVVSRRRTLPHPASTVSMRPLDAKQPHPCK